MSIGASLFLVAVGAILRYAVTWNPQDRRDDAVAPPRQPPPPRV